MARTEGSGWGGGVILYQPCEKCGKKKAFYDGSDTNSRYSIAPYKCTVCKERFYSDVLKRQKYA